MEIHIPYVACKFCLSIHECVDLCLPISQEVLIFTWPFLRLVDDLFYSFFQQKAAIPEFLLFRVPSPQILLIQAMCLAQKWHYSPILWLLEPMSSLNIIPGYSRCLISIVYWKPESPQNNNRTTLKDWLAMTLIQGY